MSIEQPTDAQIETITREVITGRAASGAYLQLLVIAVQSALGDERGKRLSLDAVGAVHDSFYAVVLRTIGTELSPVERNRRANFARSAASTLRAYIKAGGRMQSVDPLTVTKQALRERTRPVVTGTPREKAFTATCERLVGSAARLAKDSPKAAATRLRAAINTLQAQLATIERRPTGKAVRSARKAPLSLVVAARRGVNGRARAH